MDRYMNIKEQLLTLARQDENIKAIVLIGSSTRDTDKADEYSDLDVVIATEKPEEWLFGDCPEKLGSVKISFVEPTLGGGKERRMLYDGSLDVDMIVFTPPQNGAEPDVIVQTSGVVSADNPIIITIVVNE